MRIQKQYSIGNHAFFLKKALEWAKSKDTFCFLNGNDCAYRYGSFQKTLAVGSLKPHLIASDPIGHLSEIFKSNDWHFGFFGYEMLSNPDTKSLGFPNGFFFAPETIIRFRDHDRVEIESVFPPDEIVRTITSWQVHTGLASSKIGFQASENKDSYIQKVEQLKKHINRGDIYQVNYCIKFQAQDTTIDPTLVYEKLNEQTPMPFSGLLKMQDQYIICTSPERYLKREGNKIISQPMKGTAPRSLDHEVDASNKDLLTSSPKERAENTMIVDLVRNDLARFCQSGSVEVEALCEIYSFYPVHQMVSTVVGKVKEGFQSEWAIQDSFPMGSMTGAPKIRAMELISSHETDPREAFSGCLGYIGPNGDFDLNVLIRSIFYDSKKRQLSYSVGSGITSLSDPEKEYEECMLKASVIQHVLANI